MANETKRRFYNFPAKLMYGWWESDEKFKDCLQDGLRYVIFAFIYDSGFTNKSSDEEFLKAVKESFGLTSFEHEGEFQVVAKFRKRHHDIYEMWLDREIGNGVFFSIPVSTFWEMYNNPKSMNDRALFVAYLSLKSLLGKKEYMLTNQLALTTRMSCYTKLSGNIIPEAINKYNSRRRRERMMDELSFVWKVAIYSFYGCHGFYVSMKKNDQGEPDIEWLVNKVNQEKTVSQQAKEYRKELLKRCIEKNKQKKR